VVRRLAGILAADIVGYSRLMSEDERGTHARYRALHEEITKPVIDRHRGRIVKLTGDGFLAEFGSVIDAVECAVALQRSWSDTERKLPQERRLVFRAGINLGDVIFEDEDVYGDGVNLAVRFEELAEPGGICLSEDAYRQVRNKIDAGFEDLGERIVKNIAEPVHVYRVNLRQPATENKSATIIIADKPSIAILPFVSMSDAHEQDYFADGLAQDIITELSREPDIFVIAYNSSLLYKDRPRNIKTIGRDLGVRYVLEGTVRKAGNRIRVTAQLSDTLTNRYVWSERYDRSLENIFEVQDELTGAIYSTLLKKLVDIGFEQSARKKRADLGAYGHVLRAVGLISRLTRADIKAAVDAAEAALAIDPFYGRAHTALAHAYLHRALLGQADDTERELEKARTEALKAIEADRNDYWGYGVLGGAELWMGHHERAQSALERAVALGPNSADMRALNALVLNFVGRPEEGLADIKLAIRLNPNHPDWYMPIWARSLYLLGCHAEAVAVLHRLAGPRTELPPIPNVLLMIANYMADGRSSEARDLVPALLQVSPNFTLTQVPQFAPFKKQEILERFSDLLRQAGLPERPTPNATVPRPAPPAASGRSLKENVACATALDRRLKKGRYR
jgi:adenylate cyclase